MTPPNDIVWNHRLAELLAFQQVNGHLNVPRRSGTLGQWVMTQRRQYKIGLKGERTTQLSEERQNALNSIGFEWVVDKKSLRGWDDRFKDLVAFKEKYGHTNVRQKEGSLGRWVSTQRRHYRFLQEDEQSQLNQARVDRLNQIGFEWSLLKPLKTK
jgi:hypothetical protein|uniref:Helicase-associated domain-containing protein n=1 Tax=Attheya septentrionalis TaxID=420275 RepID=A0A6T7GZC1_9STRA|mmetsp:Transcript_16525/g.30066  ORF Transcript_16525/g.30066 Transcript_16525/m.30066 type:complete len:156 (+) Transcript_16525:222-689(+)|eukprot:CAMPEP_0198293480 /NCGR_PEP_ID=MMETSP1449-20131203/17341_1 /TAXON_ID=420275 /ORGANISM="Attheya septentrionalis, Strain CCMP2084" /LENGTH=155 /DNA_ID=CAMNT_0043993071 /DNA_START=209 /DNA_END=676 /DNA_ORIENTATION=+